MRNPFTNGEKPTGQGLTDSRAARARKTAQFFKHARVPWKIKLREARLLRQGPGRDPDLSEEKYWDAFTYMRDSGDYRDDELVSLSLEIADFCEQQGHRLSAMLLMAEMVEFLMSKNFEEAVSDWTFAPLIKRCLDFGLREDAERLFRHALLEIDRYYDSKCLTTDKNKSQHYLNSKMKIVRGFDVDGSHSKPSRPDYEQVNNGFVSRSAWGSFSLCT
jgi:hypothetical protein